MEVSTAEVREIFENLSAKEWDELNRRLHYFYYRYYRDYREDPQLNPEDLISSAILGVLSGQRGWDAERVDLPTLLCGVMRSVVSHTLTSRYRRPTQYLEETSELAVLKREDIQAYLQLCDELRDLVPVGDTVLARMVELLIEDPKSERRDFLALMPDVSKREGCNAYRRLGKLIRKVKEELGND
jgi:hypothetical protein